MNVILRRKDILVKLFYIMIIVILSISCSTKKIMLKESPEVTALFPIPSEIFYDRAMKSYFNITKETNISIDNNNAEVIKIGNYLAEILRPSTGYKLNIVNTGNNNNKGNIILKLISDESLMYEGYKLRVNSDNIIIESNNPAGLFYGVQTLRQLLPDEVESKTVINVKWRVGLISIKDYPRYKWRGAMLDIARHFFGIDDIKKYIDMLAFYKINRFHLHLTDDQGWRIEIKSWPKLITIGASTAVNGDRGGYLTQKEYKEILEYAKDRFITVIPEIDMPGHTNAALASYPELNCDGNAPELFTGIKVGFSSLCIEKEITYTFINDVIREMADITDGPYIHIGGDEAKSTKDEDYIKFIDKVEKIVHANGKKMIGWDEISNANISSSAITQFWATNANAVKAAAKGNQIIMSPSTRIYLDMKYNSSTSLGLNWAGYTDIKKSYDWDPSNEINGVSDVNILGVEAPLWSETIKTMDDIEYMVFPRVIGAAEIGWSQKGRRQWENYRERLIIHKNRLNIMNINYYNADEIK